MKNDNTEAAFWMLFQQFFHDYVRESEIKITTLVEQPDEAQRQLGKEIGQLVTNLMLGAGGVPIIRSTPSATDNWFYEQIAITTPTVTPDAWNKEYEIEQSPEKADQIIGQMKNHQVNDVVNMLCTYAGYERDDAVEYIFKYLEGNT